MNTALYDETDAVEVYKLRQYERLGFSHDDALTAIDQKIDWHDVERRSNGAALGTARSRFLPR